MSLTKVSYSMINGAVFNVLDYGAIGNGVADDTAAIQAAINAASPQTLTDLAGTVFLPRGKYKITQPLNLTSDNGAFNRRGVKLMGEVNGSGDYVYGTKLVGATSGKAMIEYVDNDNPQIENLTLTNAATNPSTVGIYQARKTGGTAPSLWCGNGYFRNVTITFSNDETSQNNNYGTIGIINVAGEETTYDRCEVWANLPLALSWSKTLRKAVSNLTPSTYDEFTYSPVWANVADITSGFSNTVFRTIACRFIAKGFNAPVVLLHEVGSYFAYGDFTQKRSATLSADGLNSTGYELWNAYHIVIDATAENLKTPLLFHRQAESIDINLRGDVGTAGIAVGQICFAIDAPSFTLANARITFNSPGTIPHGLITYIAPAGVGAEEPAVVTLRNCKIQTNQTFANATIDPKILYKSVNVQYDFFDTSMYSTDRGLKFPLVSKSIGTPATATALLRIGLPQVITNLASFSATVIANLHVSNAEPENNGGPSSCFVKAMWQISRNSVPSIFTITNQTVNTLTSSTNAAANNITNLTLTDVKTGLVEAELRVASVQTGTDNAEAFISGDVEIIYAGGYSRAPLITIL